MNGSGSFSTPTIEGRILLTAENQTAAGFEDVRRDMDEFGRDAARANSAATAQARQQQMMMAQSIRGWQNWGRAAGASAVAGVAAINTLAFASAGFFRKSEAEAAKLTDTLETFQSTMNTQEVLDYSEAIARAFHAPDVSAIREAMSTIAKMGPKSDAEFKKLTERTMDLSVAWNTSIPEAANKLFQASRSARGAIKLLRDEFGPNYWASTGKSLRATQQVYELWARTGQFGKIQADVLRQLEGRHEGLYKKVNEGSAAYHRFLVNLNKTWESVGKHFAPMVDDIFDGMSRLMEEYEKLGEKSKALATAFGAIGISMAAGFAIFGPQGAAIAGLAALGFEIYNLTTKFFPGFTEALSKNIADVAKWAIEGIASIKSWDDAWTRFDSFVNASFENLQAWLTEGGIQRDLKLLSSSLLNMGLDASTYAGGGPTGGGEGYTGFLERMLQAAKKKWDAEWKLFLSELTRGGHDMVVAIENGFKRAWADLFSPSQIETQYASQFMADMRASMQPGAEGLGTFLVKRIWDFAKTSWDEFVAATPQWVTDLWNAFKKAFEGTETGAFFSRLIGEITGAATAVRDTLAAAFTHLAGQIDLVIEGWNRLKALFTIGESADHSALSGRERLSGSSAAPAPIGPSGADVLSGRSSATPVTPVGVTGQDFVNAQRADAGLPPVPARIIGIQSADELSQSAGTAVGQAIGDAFRNETPAQRARRRLQSGQAEPMTNYLRPFQHGGSVAGGKPITVGESGKEVFIPKADGSIAPMRAPEAPKVRQTPVQVEKMNAAFQAATFSMALFSGTVRDATTELRKLIKALTGEGEGSGSGSGRGGGTAPGSANMSTSATGSTSGGTVTPGQTPGTVGAAPSMATAGFAPVGSSGAGVKPGSAMDAMVGGASFGMGGGAGAGGGGGFGQYGQPGSEWTTQAARNTAAASAGGAGGTPKYTGEFVDPKTNPAVNQAVLKQFEGKNLPVAIRNNNPAALSLMRQGAGEFAETMPGFVGSTPRPKAEGGFYAKYATPEHGVYASAQNLKKYGQKGIDTPAAIVRKWSTDASAWDTYANTIAKELGVSPNTKLDLSDPAIQAKILAAKSAHESGAGVPIYSRDVFERGARGEFPNATGGAPSAGAMATNTAAAASGAATAAANQGKTGPLAAEFQANRPDRYTGTIALGDQQFTYGSGGGRTSRGSAPYGTYPITPEYNGPKITKMGGFTLNKNEIWDPKLGTTRGGIALHSASGSDLDKLYSAGCFAISKDQWPAFKKALQAQIEKEGPQQITINPDGSASIGKVGGTTAQPRAAQDAAPAKAGSVAPSEADMVKAQIARGKALQAKAAEGTGNRPNADVQAAAAAAMPPSGLTTQFTDTSRASAAERSTFSHLPVRPDVPGSIGYPGNMPTQEPAPTGARQHGGPVSTRTPYMVGEMGPEMFVPTVTGNIMPLRAPIPGQDVFAPPSGMDTPGFRRVGQGLMQVPGKAPAQPYESPLAKLMRGRAMNPDWATYEGDQRDQAKQQREAARRGPWGRAGDYANTLGQQAMNRIPGVAMVKIGAQMEQAGLPAPGDFDRAKLDTERAFASWLGRNAGPFATQYQRHEAMLEQAEGKGPQPPTAAQIREELLARTSADQSLAYQTASRQHGGPVSRNTRYMVGESGPEMFMPMGGGRRRDPLENLLQTPSLQLGRGKIDVQLKLDKNLIPSKPAVQNAHQFDLGVNVDRTGTFFSRPGDPAYPPPRGGII